VLAEIPYPRIDPILVRIGSLKVHWYGVCYIIGFVLAALVLHGLARRRRWPVEPQRVVDVLFWGILGVFVGGRLGYFFFYGLTLHYKWWQIIQVWKGGMSFHGGLLGVIVAYWIYAWRTGTPRGQLFDGLALATAPGLGVVRLGNFINAELWGRAWNGPWAMRFPLYHEDRFHGTIAGWEKARAAGVPHDLLYGPLRHPSQLYEMLGEGVLLYFVLRWLMLRRGWGGGRISAAFLVGYGVIRFCIEFFREPDEGIGFQVLHLTRGQLLCSGMILAGLVVWFLCKPFTPPAPEAAPPARDPAEDAPEA
jgi:phosphatidylglycerol:prolipoprotein diacylglycerol transferase